MGGSSTRPIVFCIKIVRLSCRISPTRRPRRATFAVSPILYNFVYSPRTTSVIIHQWSLSDTFEGVGVSQRSVGPGQLYELRRLAWLG